MRTTVSISIGICILSGILVVPLSAQESQQPEPQQQEGLAERIGRQLDLGLSELGSELRQGWQEAREQVSKFGLRGRVYARLHWDKRLQGSNLDVDIQDTQTVILHGTVPDSAAKEKAVELARETEGIERVVDRLEISPAGR